MLPLNFFQKASTTARPSWYGIDFHIPCDGDSTDRQWLFSGAVRRLDSERPASRAVGHRDRDDKLPGEEGDGKRLEVEHVGELPPWFLVGDTEVEGSRRDLGRKEDKMSPAGGT